MSPEELRETFIGHALIAYPITKDKNLRGKQLEIFISFDLLLTGWIADLNAGLDVIGNEYSWHKAVLIRYIDLISPWVRYSRFEGDKEAKSWRDQNIDDLGRLRVRMRNHVPGQ